MRERSRIRLLHAIGSDYQLTPPPQRFPGPVGVGQADDRIGRHDPHRFDATIMDGIE